MTLRTILQNFLNHSETLEIRKKEGDDQFDKEFQLLKALTESLRSDSQYSCSQGEKDVNRRKNRYKDILPYDYTRVILSEIPGIPGSDYVNANFIRGASGSMAYIASQGPLPHTIDTFWKMVWECEIQVIVMASSEMEGGKHKCERYWAFAGEERKFGDIIVTLVRLKQVCSDFVVRTLQAVHGSEERTVIQFHYVTWPDHGVPDSVSSMLSMVRLVRDCQASETVPVLVHCSAGCGRTGTICAIDHVWGLLRAGKLTNNFQLFELVADMRRQRIAMVQTKEQYILVHRAVTELFEQHMKVIDSHPYENVDFSGAPINLNDDVDYEFIDGEENEPAKESVKARSGQEQPLGIDSSFRTTSISAPPIPEKRKNGSRRNRRKDSNTSDSGKVKHLISTWNNGQPVGSGPDDESLAEKSQTPSESGSSSKASADSKESFADFIDQECTFATPADRHLPNNKAVLIRKPSIAKLRAIFERPNGKDGSNSKSEMGQDSEPGNGHQSGDGQPPAVDQTRQKRSRSPFKAKPVQPFASRYRDTALKVYTELRQPESPPEVLPTPPTPPQSESDDQKAGPVFLRRMGSRRGSMTKPASVWYDGDPPISVPDKPEVPALPVKRSKSLKVQGITEASTPFGHFRLPSPSRRKREPSTAYGNKDEDSTQVPELQPNQNQTDKKETSSPRKILEKLLPSPRTFRRIRQPSTFSEQANNDIMKTPTDDVQPLENTHAGSSSPMLERVKRLPIWNEPQKGNQPSPVQVHTYENVVCPEPKPSNAIRRKYFFGEREEMVPGFSDGGIQLVRIRESMEAGISHQKQESHSMKNVKPKPAVLPRQNKASPPNQRTSPMPKACDERSTDKHSPSPPQKRLPLIQFDQYDVCLPSSAHSSCSPTIKPRKMSLEYPVSDQSTSVPKMYLISAPDQNASNTNDSAMASINSGDNSTKTTPLPSSSSSAQAVSSPKLLQHQYISAVMNEDIPPPLPAKKNSPLSSPMVKRTEIDGFTKPSSLATELCDKTQESRACTDEMKDLRRVDAGFLVGDHKVGSNDPVPILDNKIQEPVPVMHKCSVETVGNKNDQKISEIIPPSTPDTSEEVIQIQNSTSLQGENTDQENLDSHTKEIQSYSAYEEDGNVTDKLETDCKLEENEWKSGSESTVGLSSETIDISGTENSSISSPTESAEQSDHAETTDSYQQILQNCQDYLLSAGYSNVFPEMHRNLQIIETTLQNYPRSGFVDLLSGSDGCENVTLRSSAREGNTSDTVSTYDSVPDLIDIKDQLENQTKMTETTSEHVIDRLNEVQVESDYEVRTDTKSDCSNVTDQFMELSEVSDVSEQKKNDYERLWFSETGKPAVLRHPDSMLPGYEANKSGTEDVIKLAGLLTVGGSQNSPVATDSISERPQMSTSPLLCERDQQACALKASSISPRLRKRRQGGSNQYDGDADDELQLDLCATKNNSNKPTGVSSNISEIPIALTETDWELSSPKLVQQLASSWEKNGTCEPSWNFNSLTVVKEILDAEDEPDIVEEKEIQPSSQSQSFNRTVEELQLLIQELQVDLPENKVAGCSQKVEKPRKPQPLPRNIRPMCKLIEDEKSEQVPSTESHHYSNILEISDISDVDCHLQTPVEVIETLVVVDRKEDHEYEELDLDGRFSFDRARSDNIHQYEEINISSCHMKQLKHLDKRNAPLDLHVYVDPNDSMNSSARDEPANHIYEKVKYGIVSPDNESPPDSIDSDTNASSPLTRSINSTSGNLEDGVCSQVLEPATSNLYSVVTKPAGQSGAAMTHRYVMESQNEQLDTVKIRYSKDDLELMPIAPPRSKRNSLQRRSWDVQPSHSDNSWRTQTLPGRLSGKKSLSKSFGSPKQKPIRWGEEWDSDEDSHPAPPVPAKTKESYMLPTESSNGSDGSGSSYRAQILTGASPQMPSTNITTQHTLRSRTKFSFLTKLGLRNDGKELDSSSISAGKSFRLNPSPTNISLNSGAHLLGSSSTSALDFPHRLPRKPHGPRDPPLHWTQVGSATT